MATSTEHPTTVYKILTGEQWAEWASSGTFTGAGIDVKDGYIHLSTDQQVVETYDRYFQGQDNIVLVVVDLTKIGDPVRWEPSRHGQLFPHVYGSIDKSAVLSHQAGWRGQKPGA